MALPQFNELAKADVSKYTKARDGIKYLPWVRCLKLLYEHGAEDVQYETLLNEYGHSVFILKEGAMISPDEKTNRAVNPLMPEIHVKVTVDEKSMTMAYPLINGIECIRAGRENQMLVNTARQRAYVKCVAMLTGLGISLWDDETEVEETRPKGLYDDIKHIERLYTVAVKKHGEEKVLQILGSKRKSLETLFKAGNQLVTLEKKLQQLP